MSESNPSENTSKDILLPNPMPEAEYMYGCTPTALGMLLGYYDLYGYRGADLSNLIDGVVTLNARGTDGNAYDMDAFDTVLGRFIASEEFVYRFVTRDYVYYVTPAQELEYAFVNGGTTLNTSAWNCLADFIGTGQYWRRNSDLGTSLAYDTLENIAKSTSTITVTGDGQSRTIEYKYTTMLYGLDLLVKSRGYNLDYEITGTFATDNNGGSFTFEDYMAEIDAGRPVLISITEHAMVGYGYNAETREIIFDDCYTADQRMVWGESYYYAGEDRTLQSITVIGFKTSASSQTRDLKLTSCEGHSETIVIANAKAASGSTPYFYANDKLYLNFAVGNDGNSACGAFVVAIYLNGVRVRELSVSNLGANAVREFRDIELGTAVLGNNSVKIVVDDGNQIQETTGTNNELEKGFLVLTQDTRIISSGSSTIASGKDLSQAFITSGGKVIVSGGTATDAILGDCSNNNGGIHVRAGGITERITVYSGGKLFVSKGGKASDVSIYSDGNMTVSSGGTATEVVVYSGASLNVASGGTANSATINANGRLSLISGGVAHNATIDSLGKIIVYNGTVNDTIVNARGALLRIYSRGGVANHTTVNEGVFDVWSGGIANSTTVNSRGEFDVFSGGAANGIIINPGGYLHVYSYGKTIDVKENGGYVRADSDANISFVSNTFSGLVLSSGTATVHSGTTAVNAEVNNLGRFYIYSGGMAHNLITMDSGWTYVSGGEISNVSIGSQAFLLLESGGLVNDLNVMSGGMAYFYDCTVGKTTVERGGTLIVSGKVTLTDDLFLAGLMNVENTCEGINFVNSKNHAVVFDLTQCPANNEAFISDLTQFSNFSLSVKMSETQESGEYRLAYSASSFTDSITVSLGSGGSTSLSVGGNCTIGQLNCTLTATNGWLSLNVVNSSTQKTPDLPEYVPGTWSTDWAQASKYAKEHDMMIFAFYGDRTWCTSAEYMTKYLMETEDFRELSKSVVLLYNTPVPNQSYSGFPRGYLLDANGNMLAQRGGFGRSTHDSWMTWLRVMLGEMPGIYLYDELQTFTSLGKVTSGKTISSATSIFVCKDGIIDSTMVVSSGATMLVFSGGAMTNTTIQNQGMVYIFTGGIANNTKVESNQKNSFYGLNVCSGGTANSTTVNAGNLRVYSGGTANNTTVNAGNLVVSNGGLASRTTVNTGSLSVLSGGIANSAMVNAGDMDVYSGGIANSTVINSSGRFYINYSGTASRTTINAGHMYVSTGGTANSTTVNAGDMDVYSGGTVNSVVINSRGWLQVYGSVNGVVLNDNGGCTIRSNAVAGDITVNSGGSLYVTSDGRLTGRMTFETGATVEAYNGARIDFDLTRTIAGGAALVNNLSVIKGSPIFTLTVNGKQISGTYNLTDGAKGFNKTITVRNASGTDLGTLTVGDGATEIGGTKYTLNLGGDGVLSVKVNSISVLSPTNLVGTVNSVSWKLTGSERYKVEYSNDFFEHVISVITAGNTIDTPDLPAGTYQWRVKEDDNSDWAVGEAIVSETKSAIPKVVQSNEDGNDDLFFASPNGIWDYRYYARHVGAFDDWIGTNELVSANGKGRIQNLYFGSADPNVLCLTDAENGDAIFVDDVYTELPETVAEHTARLYKIQEVRAGAGDDIVDMTSQQFEYIGDGLTIRGGEGNDTIWANKGDNWLFGDAGNDRIVGASGNDVIAGGIGNDRMHGGGGDDVFTFCDNWGEDTVEQLATGSVILWFASGDESKWNTETLTYTDGENSVKVSGVAAEKVTLKFGDDVSSQYKKLATSGAFAEFTSQKIFENADTTTGAIASLE